MESSIPFSIRFGGGKGVLLDIIAWRVLLTLQVLGRWASPPVHKSYSTLVDDSFDTYI